MAKGTCKRCTHGIEHHRKGPCTYGHKTLFKGCRCPGFNARKSVVDVPLAEEKLSEQAYQNARSYLFEFLKGIRAACERLEASLGSGVVYIGNAKTAPSEASRTEINPEVVLRKVPRILEQAGYSRDLKIQTRDKDQEAIAIADRMDEERYYRDGPGSTRRDDDPLSKCERNILTALAQGGAMSHDRLAIRAGYSPKSGGFMQALADLRDVDFVRGGKKEIGITEPGIMALGDYDPLPEDGDNLLTWWLHHRKKKGEQDILRSLHHLGEATHDELAKYIGKSSKSGGYMGDLANLRKLGLIEGNGKAIRLAKELRS